MRDRTPRLRRQPRSCAVAARRRAITAQLGARAARRQHPDADVHPAIRSACRPSELEPARGGRLTSPDAGPGDRRVGRRSAMRVRARAPLLVARSDEDGAHARAPRSTARSQRLPSGSASASRKGRARQSSSDPADAERYRRGEASHDGERRPCSSTSDSARRSTLLRETRCAAFARAEIAPLAAEIDATNEFPRALWPKLGALGVLGITVERNTAARASVISRTASRWRRSAARRPRGAVVRCALEPVREPDSALRHRRSRSSVTCRR